MGRRPVKSKRKPSDYPLFAFRVSREAKERISQLIEQTQTRLNRKRADGAPFVNKNDVIVEALELGLKALR